MANHKSAAKQARQSEKRRLRNRWWRTRLRTQLKKFRLALEKGERDTAAAMLSETLGLVDRSAKAGILHVNAADRTKGRLQRAFNKLPGQASS